MIIIRAVFYTSAYNAEKTIERTIKSVLNQTHQDFIYYLCDNVSTDKTKEIIETYAAKDNRIIPWYNKISYGKRLCLVFNESNVKDDDYFCVLDADDEYKPDFLEKMLSFIKEHELDIAICGNDVIDVAENKIVEIRKLGKNLIAEDDGFGKHFPLYHPFSRAVWAKLYRISLLRQADIEKYRIKFRLSFGSDTLFVLKAYSEANRIGVLAESLHKYYVYPKSASYIFDNKRIKSDRVLHEETSNFLIKKAGYVSDVNKEWLFMVYLNAIKDTVNVFIRAEIDVKEDIPTLHDIFTHEITREMAVYPFVYKEKRDARKEFFQLISDWIISQKESRKLENLQYIAEIYAGMNYLPTKFDGWNDKQEFSLLVKIKDCEVSKTMENKVSKQEISNAMENKISKQEVSNAMENKVSKQKPSNTMMNKLNKQIVSLVSKNSLLVNLDADFCSFFRDIIILIITKNATAALDKITQIINEQQEIPDTMRLNLITLALNIAAQLEKMDYFIFYKKLQVSLLLDAGLRKRAKEELAEWPQLMPDDEDFKKLARKL